MDMFSAIASVSKPTVPDILQKLVNIEHGGEVTMAWHLCTTDFGGLL